MSDTLIKKYVIAELHTPEWRKEVKRHVVFTPNPDEHNLKMFYDTEEEAEGVMKHLNGVYRIHVILPVWSTQETFDQEENYDSTPKHEKICL
jgi:hypothetical protein